MAHGSLSLLEALDNLEAVIDAPSWDVLELEGEHHLKLRETTEESVYGTNDQERLEVISKTFHVVQIHLQHLYQQLQEQGRSPVLVEGMSAVMGLVGEATKKLEENGLFLKQSIQALPTYQELQKFYRTKLVRVLQPVVGSSSENYPLNNLSELKADEIYELFYLKTEEGSDFYSAELANRIKLACDFGEYAHMPSGEDPLIHVKSWEDMARHKAASTILDQIYPLLKRYFSAKIPRRGDPVVREVNACVMALMLAAQSHQLLRQFAVKGCMAYYQDFIVFLRQVVRHPEYQRLRLQSHPSQSEQGIVMALIDGIVQAFFHAKPYREEIWHFLTTVLCPQEKKFTLTSQALQKVFTRLDEVLKQHPSGPVLKALDIIRHEEEARYFDPLLLGCLPEQEACVHQGNTILSLIRIGSPTIQHVIHKAYVTEEFKEYLRSLSGRVLFVNLQNRTSWQEKARTHAIEQLAQHAEFCEKIVVITLPVGTEFYQQTGAYADCEEASAFLTQLHHHVQEEATGYFFSPTLQEIGSGGFLEKLLQEVHSAYFDHKAKLSVEERRTFLSIVFNAMILKSLELSHSQEIMISSKDGLDLSVMEIAQFLLLMAPKKEDPHAVKAILTLLLGPILLNREREMVHSCCERLVALLAQVERHPEGLKALNKVVRLPSSFDTGTESG